MTLKYTGKNFNTGVKNCIEKSLHHGISDEERLDIECILYETNRRYMISIIRPEPRINNCAVYLFPERRV